jgi:Helix-turn-helix domain
MVYDEVVSIILGTAMAKRFTTAKRGNCTQLDLQKRRLNKGLSLEDIADTTKISIRFLRAIEDEEFEKLPGGIFNTSYLRQYAAAVDFDEGKLLAHYSRTVHPADPTEEAPNRGLFKWLRVSAAAGR